MRLVEFVKPCVVDIAINVHGTRAVQTLIEVLSKDTKQNERLLMSVIDCMIPHIKELSLVCINLNLIHSLFRTLMETM